LTLCDEEEGEDGHCYLHLAILNITYGLLQKFEAKIAEVNDGLYDIDGHKVHQSIWPGLANSSFI
jgi:hypothetical protein